MGFRVPGSEIPTKQKITGFLAHSTCSHVCGGGKLAESVRQDVTRKW